MRGQIEISRHALGFEIEQNFVSLLIEIIPTVKNVPVPPRLERLFLISLFDNDGIPPALRQLMEQNKVTEAQIRKAVAGRGYYPEATPIKNYDSDFVSGVLVGAWPQVYQLIKENN